MVFTINISELRTPFRDISFVVICIQNMVDVIDGYCGTTARQNCNIFGIIRKGTIDTGAAYEEAENIIKLRTDIFAIFFRRKNILKLGIVGRRCEVKFND